ncbi:MAG TPA: DUF6056 family protein [Pyrinomonadaceae bacterium]|nr:DUF6056 family protein [Pyrinomonadaceae bacterium]
MKANRGQEYLLNLPRMWRRIFLLLLLALFSIPLVTHIYLGSCSRLVADDFCSAAIAHSQGIIRGALYWYMNWTGRYAANLLDTLLASIGPGANPYETGLIVIIWFVTLAFAVYQLIRDDERDMRALLSCITAAMVLFSTLEVIPSIGQSLYWAQARSGVPSLILGTAYVALIARRINASMHNKRWLLVSALLTFIAAGFAETYSVVQTTALVFALVVGWISNHYAAPNKRSYLLLLIAGLAGSLGGGLLMVLAPGNKFRRTPFPPPPGVPDLLHISMRGLREFFYVVVLSPTRAPVWVGLILCGFVFGQGIFQRHESTVRERRHLVSALVWLPAVTFVLLVACWVPMAWGTSLTLANRTFIIPAYVLVCLVICWAYFAGQLCRRSYHLFPPHLRALATVLPILTLVVFGLFAVNRSWQMLQLRPTLEAYALAWDNREHLIQSAKSQGLNYAVVPRLQHWTGLDEIELDPKITWLTKCFQDYYGIQVIPELGDLSGEPNGEIKQAALEDQFESIHILPGSVSTELNRIYKTTRGKVGFYKIDLPPDKIKSYYETELARVGWKYIGSKKVEAFKGTAVAHKIYSATVKQPRSYSSPPRMNSDLATPIP